VKSVYRELDMMVLMFKYLILCSVCLFYIDGDSGVGLFVSC